MSVDERTYTKTQVEALLAIRTISELAGGRVAQFLHKFERVPGTEYQLQHVREGCEFCDALGVIKRAVESNQASEPEAS